MIMKMCRKCGKLINYPNTYCDNCREKYQAEREKQLKESKKKYDADYDKTKRNKEHQRFYNSKEWQMLRDKYLQDHQYKCEECIELHNINPKYKINLAVEVHHIKWLSTSEGWEKRLDYNNLKALCHYHHDKVHGRFKRKNKYIR